MGLKDKMIKKAAEIEERRPQFTPLELTEGNVQAIFNRCLAKEGEGNITYAQVLQPALTGKQSDLVRFSKERIRANSKNISYLLGQLKGVHQKEELMLLEYGIMAYSGIKWTLNIDILLKLYEVGMVNINLTPFSLQEDGKTLVTDIRKLKPTLSPKDPNFPAWWEAHKSEWVD